MSEPSKAGDGSLERLREEATDDVANKQIKGDNEVAKKMTDAADKSDDDS